MSEVPWPRGSLQDWPDLIQSIRQDLRLHEYFDLALDPEVQTDKQLVKALPCQFCKRPLIVTTFYVLAWAKCGACTGKASKVRAPGSVEVTQVGRTEPKLAADLTKILINPAFATTRCPVQPDNETHVMELKSVHWSDAYGPHEWRRDPDTKGGRVLVQVAPGETVIHQCLNCSAVVTFSTTAVTQFKRINEVRVGKNANSNAIDLGTRDDVLDQWKDRLIEWKTRDELGIDDETADRQKAVYEQLLGLEPGSTKELP